MLSNSGQDERGLYSGGSAGDQSGREWSLIPWYQYPWDGGWHCVLHHPNANVRKMIAQLATEAAENNLIGYDQAERYTYWLALSKAGYYPRQINTPCEADCSAGVLANVKAVGYLLNDEKMKEVSIYGYTGTEKKILMDAGFECRTDAKYLVGDDYLYAGDILLNVYNHTCTCVTDGAKITTPEYKKEYYLIKPEYLKKGSTGIDVFRVKCILKARGFYKNAINDVYGKKAKEAVKLFQQAAGLKKQTGNFNLSTRRTLYGLEEKDEYFIVYACKLGDESTSVLLLQEFLKALGYYTGELDRSFGNQTKTALIAFQKKANKKGANLPTNGVWDKKTIQYMIG